MASKEQLRIRADKKRVKEIYNNQCANVEQCHSTEKPHIHHIVFRCQEGKNATHQEIENKANYVPLCWFCERKLHEMAK